MMENAPKIFKEETVKTEGMNNYLKLKEVWKSAADHTQKWLGVMALGAMLSSGAMAGEKKERSQADEAGNASRKAKPERLEKKKDTDPAHEMRQILVVENMCKDAGFDIDKYDSAVTINLPPKPVRKIFVNIGQTHKGETYVNNPEGKDYIVKKQNLIFHLLRNSFLKTKKVVPCLNEGICNSEQASYCVPDEKAEKAFREYVSTVVSSGEALTDEARYQAGFIDESVKADPSQYYPGLIKNLYLFDIARHAETAINSREVSVQDKIKLQQFHQSLSPHIDFGLITYELGGPGLAARYGYVKILPAEEAEAFNAVALNVQREVGFRVSEGENIYEVIRKLPEDKQDKANAAIVKFGTSKEREGGALACVQRALSHAKFAVMVYGNGHDLGPEFDELQEMGHLDDVAMVKIDTDRFDLEDKAASSARKKK